MLLRKINAVISLLITFLLLGHAISISVWALSKGSIPEHSGIVPWILTGLVVIHAFISIDMVISGLLNGEKHKSKKYLKLNASTVFQRASGILMIVFIGLHIAGSAGYMQPPKIVHAILPVLFFTMVMAHIVVSTSKAFITLGIGNARFIKLVDIVIRVICGVVLIADVIGFYLYLV